jgi:hypothetical protein
VKEFEDMRLVDDAGRIIHVSTDRQAIEEALADPHTKPEVEEMSG